VTRPRVAAVAAAWITLASALASGLAAHAGSLAVAPLRLTLTNAAGIASLTVENKGSEEALVQTETFAWQQAGGEHRLTPTEDVVAMPPVFRLAPGGQRQVRVGLTRALTETHELTYRLTVTEVPTTVVPGTVAVAVRHSLPVFVRPATPIAPRLSAKFTSPAGLEIANTGSQHLRIDRWRLRNKDGAIIGENSGPGYLLAGAKQSLMVDAVHAGGSARFEADSDNRTLTIAVGE
jgi:fimbrial chaperone protein